MNYLTPEIEKVIKKKINTIFFRFGLTSIIIIILLAISFYYLFTIALNRANEKFISNLEKNQSKNVELWKQQKDLMFEYVTFLEEKIFNNPNLSQDLSPNQILEEKRKVSMENNIYYAKLYLVMETPIIEKINEYIKNDISSVQRYYLYKELREQLIGVLHDNYNRSSDFPYIAGKPDGIIFLEENGKLIQRNARDIDELKKHYPFIEEHDKEKGMIKTLPFLKMK